MPASATLRLGQNYDVVKYAHSCLCVTHSRGPVYTIIQICHASVGILIECLPEGGWFSRGRSPSENHPPKENMDSYIRM